MNGWLRSGPVVLALGIALAGCNQGPGNHIEPKVATANSASEYVLTVEGMV